MKGVVLAAGCGTRMGGHLPKSLLAVGDSTLIDRNVALMRACAGSVSVVVGYEAARFMAHFGADVLFIYNEVYRETGSLFSLWLAYEVLREPLLVAFADVYVSRNVSRIARMHPDRVIVARGYDGRGVRLYLDERRRVVRASAATDPDPSGFRFSGYARLSQSTLEAIVKVPDFETASLGFGLIGCKAIEVAGPSVNVNTPEDLDYARRLHRGNSEQAKLLQVLKETVGLCTT